MKTLALFGTRGWDLKAWKYRLADLLNRLPGTCWANLVCWVEFGSPLWEAFDQRLCRQDLAANGRCYCGTLRSEAEAARDATALLQRPGQPCVTCRSSFCSAGEGCDGIPF